MRKVVSSGSEWVRISTRDDEYNKWMNGMNSTKVNDIKDKVNAHTCRHTYQIYTYIQTYIYKKNVHRIGACRGMARHHI